MTLAIAHVEQEVDEADVPGRVIVVLDAIREARPPFDPSAVVRDFAATLRAYGCAMVTGDRYGGQWVAEVFARHGIAYWPSAQARSELYGNFLPLVMTATVELLDHPRCLAQLAGLERRPSASGRDAIDHGRTGHDDVINSVAGACVAAQRQAVAADVQLVVLG